jgi:hypothetical protein
VHAPFPCIFTVQVKYNSLEQWNAISLFVKYNSLVTYCAYAQ